MSVQHFCPQCGSKINQSSQFCEACGLELFSEELLDDKNLKPSHNQEKNEMRSNNPKSIKYANDGDRLVAYIVDGILFSVIGRLIGLIFGIPLNIDLVGSLWNNNWPVIAVSFLYLFLFEAFNNGQTLGKMIFKIQTVDEKSFGKISTKQAALHTIGKLFLPIDIIIGLISRDKSESDLEKNQVRFTQKFSQTSVISLK